jgi:hypothetical protein
MTGSHGSETVNPCYKVLLRCCAQMQQVYTLNFQDWRCNSTIAALGTGWRWSASRPNPLYPQENAAVAIAVEWEHQSLSGRCKENKCPYRELNSACPARRYIDWVIPAPHELRRNFLNFENTAVESNIATYTTRTIAFVCSKQIVGIVRGFSCRCRRIVAIRVYVFPIEAIVFDIVAP